MQETVFSFSLCLKPSACQFYQLYMKLFQVRLKKTMIWDLIKLEKKNSSSFMYSNSERAPHRYTRKSLFFHLLTVVAFLFPSFAYTYNNVFIHPGQIHTHVNAHAQLWHAHLQVLTFTHACAQTPRCIYLSLNSRIVTSFSPTLNSLNQDFSFALSLSLSLSLKHTHTCT